MLAAYRATAAGAALKQGFTVPIALRALRFRSAARPGAFCAHSSPPLRTLMSLSNEDDVDDKSKDRRFGSEAKEISKYTEKAAERAALVSQSRRECRWPISKANTIINVCPEGSKMVVERLGSLHSVRGPGWFFSIPIVDRIAFMVDMRERNIRYPPQAAITKDNVSVDVSAVLFVQFEDAAKACYGASNPLTSVVELAKSAMRTSVGEMELDELFHSRQTVNEVVRNVVKDAAANWGIVVKRHEILDVTPDAHISDAMDKQAAAERMRREKVLQAEGKKRSAELESEGMKIRLANESEGDFTRVVNEAKASAEAVVRKAESEAQAIEIIAAALELVNGKEGKFQNNSLFVTSVEDWCENNLFDSARCFVVDSISWQSTNSQELAFVFFSNCVCLSTFASCATSCGKGLH